MKKIILAVACLSVVACSPKVPNSMPQRGVGFGDYTSYEASREAALQGGAPITVAPIDGPAPTPVAAMANNPTISDEQSFDAVSARQTIESDAQRLERQRAAYRQVSVEALPQRSADLGPNVVQFALSTTNSVGQPLYDRGRTSEKKYARACAEYSSPDIAQEAFLAAGGPQKDKLGVDPDGDGFACRWNPAPFRAARG